MLNYFRFKKETLSYPTFLSIERINIVVLCLYCGFIVVFSVYVLLIANVSTVGWMGVLRHQPGCFLS